MASPPPSIIPLLRPTEPQRTRILFLAKYAPEEPAFLPKSYPGCGGYPQYYHRIWQTLTELGYPVRTATQCTSVLTAGGNVDLVFSLYNRMPVHQPEVIVPALCELLRIACVGAPPNTRALAEDKWHSKLAARAVGLPVADAVPYENPAHLSKAPPFAGPYFVKNRYGAASEGVDVACIQDDWAGAKRIAERFFERGMVVLVERFAPGIDVTVPILGGEPPLVLGLVRSNSDKPESIITEDLKRDDPLGYTVLEPDKATSAAFTRDAELWLQAVGPADYGRMDFRFDPATGRRAFLEFNLCCHIGRSSAICLAAARLGATQADVLGHVIETAVRRNQHRPDRRRWVL